MSILASVPQLLKKGQEKTAKRINRYQLLHPFLPSHSLMVCYSMFTLFQPAFTSSSWFIGEELLVNDCSALTRERYPVVLLLSELLGESPVPSIPQGGLDRCLGFSLYVIFVNGK
jgi:hypothetical protein